MPKLGKRWTVRGRVQGVFFRATTQQVALNLGLTGWASNRDDGTVEVVAFGTESRLQELETWLWQGPDAALVEDVLGEDLPVQVVDGFDIRG